MKNIHILALASALMLHPHARAYAEEHNGNSHCKTCPHTCGNSRIAIDEQHGDINLTESRIIISPDEDEVIRQAARMLSDDIQAVTDKKIRVDITKNPKGTETILAGTIGRSPWIDKLVKDGKLDVTEIAGGWEQFVVKTIDHPLKNIEKALVIVGCDRRGTAYGLLTISEEAGVNPWTWWADVPAKKRPTLRISADYVSKKPSVKYRGFFINDEDWGLKPWASHCYEKETGDIGPKTYARVCELLLRIKGNMLAPAMHSCTGAFYSHKRNKLVADSFGIIITTSHCEPLLLNNAASSEWDIERDGDWNYKTNAPAIKQKWNDRLAEASRFENIYTTAMRGLHDAGLRGQLSMPERVALIEQVMADQRLMLSRHKKQAAESIPQIFVPYKETMDIYENGLHVPDDITLVWVDDNYGYMKRVSNPEERQRSGRAGVYYHLSYLGAPHDYLWLCTTPPVLMYNELKKAYDTGADRYWLLNVGDIKPMELGIQTFFDIALDIDGFDFKRANDYQSGILSDIFGMKYRKSFRRMLNEYYRLAWSRKPEFMGWEREWDPHSENKDLQDTEFSFDNYNEAQRRLADYKTISNMADCIERDLPEPLRDAFFEMLGYSVKASYQMNRKFLMAQLNHNLAAKGMKVQANGAAAEAEAANDSIAALTRDYNGRAGGKWNGMMDVPPGICALYQNMPPLTRFDGAGTVSPDIRCTPDGKWAEGCQAVELSDYSNLVEKDGQTIDMIMGMGYDWQVVRLGAPQETDSDPASPDGARIEYRFTATGTDSVDIYLYTVPFFPLYSGKATRIGIMVDNGTPQVYDNVFTEYSDEWKDQVLRNGDVQRFRFPINKNTDSHTLSFIRGNAGMMIQKVIIDMGGLKKSYIGPTAR